MSNGTLILTYRYRLNPEARQHRALERILEQQRQLYNAALEERIEALDSQIAASSSEAIPQITTQMNSIEQRLSATEKQLGGLATIENSIQKLFASLEEGRAEARTLATSAAMTASGGTTEPSAELQALQDGLAAVRANAETADQRTQATLEAVHETLAQIITRRYFPISARTIRTWPLAVWHPNKKAVHRVSEALEYAEMKMQEASAVRQGG